MVFNVHIQHPVGQGFMHSGLVLPLLHHSIPSSPDSLHHDVQNLEDLIRFGQSGRGFSYIYDCGTHNKSIFLQNAIGHESPPTPKPTIDLLIISHFHHDHINGLHYLLERFHVETVIIPYVGKVEAILLYLQAGMDIDASSGDPNGKFMRDFTGDPAGTLLKLDVGRVIQIKGNPEDDDDPDNDTEWPKESPENQREVEFPEKPLEETGEGVFTLGLDLSRLKRVSEKDGTKKSSSYIMEEKQPLMVRGKLKTDRRYAFPLVWAFIFHLDSDYGDEDTFIRALKKVLNKIDGNNYSNKDVKRKLADPDWVKDQLVGNLSFGSTSKNLFRKAYDKMLRMRGKKKSDDINGTSLCAYSGPPPMIYLDSDILEMLDDMILDHLRHDDHYLRHDDHYLWHEFLYKHLFFRHYHGRRFYRHKHRSRSTGGYYYTLNNDDYVDIKGSPGWLGTGDAKLKSTKAINKLCRRYRTVLRNIGTVTVPHHGARDYSSFLTVSKN